MTLDELAAEALIWHKRPDKDSAARSAIRRCILKYHRREKFFKDIVSVSVNNPTPGLPTAIIPIAANFPNFRQFSHITLAGHQKPLVAISVDSLLDLDGYAKNDVYLVAGTNLNILSTAGFPSIDVSYYRDPNVSTTATDSWIANEYPDLIAAGAAASVLAFDNESEIYKAAKQEEMEQWSTLVMNNLESEAR